MAYVNSFKGLQMAEPIGVTKTFHESLHRLLQGGIIFMFLIFVSVNIGWGQAYTPIQYKFQDKPNQTSDLNSASLPSFPSMASNGYGLWVVDGRADRWLLLGNGIAQMDTTANLVVPPGTIASGTLSPYNIGEAKVAANLNGSVRFVWYDELNQEFVVQGFNDQSFDTSDTNQKQIDINISALPKPSLTRSVIKRDIFEYPRVSAPGVLNTVTDSDWRNEFDIAIDRKYLYIVYRLYNASADTINGKPFSIVIKATELKTGTVTNTYSKLDAFRPTIACDVRNNPDAPTFDVGYLEPIVASSVWVGWKIWHLNWANGTFTGAKQLPKFVRQPITATSTFNANNLTTASYQTQVIYQVRIVVSSKDGGTVSPQAKSMYILKYSPGQEATRSELYYQKYLPVTSAWDTAEYVDGPLNLAGRGCPTCPLQDGFYYSVVTEPIVAFANPYDGKRDPQNFEEFHCVYRLWNDVPDAATQLNPLTIVREGENGIIRASEPDTRRILNKTKNTQGNWVGLPTPYYGYDTYAATANQMGVHVLWDNQAQNKIYYTRDARSFDENIEENTLVTHDTYVGDGTTHQGTFGTKLLPGKCLTLWTDPSFALSTNGTATNSGVYFAKASHGQSYYNGRIIFLKNSFGDLQDVKLEIGNSANHISSAAYLVLSPNYEFRLSDTASKNQQIIIHPYSTINSFSYPFLSFPQSTSIKQQFYGKGTITMDSNSTLTCHGGSTFLVPDYFSLNATKTNFLFKAEPSVVPPYPSTNPLFQDQITGLNVTKVGALRISGTASLNYCELTAEHVYDLSNVVEITSTLLSSSSGLPSMQFEAIGCAFNGRWPVLGTWYGVGTFQILAKNYSYNPYRNIRIFESTLQGANIRVENPDNDVEITACWIFRTHAVPIEFKRTNTSTYGNLRVLNNDIYCDQEFGCLGQSGIIMDRFDSRRSDDVGGDRILIQDNELCFQGETSPSIDDNQAAIRLIRTSANVKANIISSCSVVGGYRTNKYWKGIVSTGDKNLVDPRSNSFICSNRISGCADAGLHTEAWDGYAKSNQISECGVGHFSVASDEGSILFSRYFNNTGAGLKVQSQSEPTTIYLEGKHEGSDDYAAYDTIDHNNSSGVSGQIEVVRTSSSVVPDIEFGDTSTNPSIYATFGHNNIISNSVNDKLIHYIPAIGVPGNITFDDFNENFWGHGNWGSITPVTLLGTSDTTYMPNITYGPTNPSSDTEVYSVGTGIECGVEFGTGARSGGQRPQNLLVEDVDCYRLRSKAKGLLDAFKNRQAYDTARYLLENCYSNLEYVTSFLTATSAAQGLSQEDTAEEKIIFADYRQWLVDVIHLNPDSMWYCSDVSQIFSTFNYYPNGRGKDYNGAISLLKYLIDSSGCGGDSIYWVRWQSIREDQMAIWRDTVQDSINSLLDTSLVSLEELGLSGIRGQQNSVSPVSVTAVSRLASVTAERNPFTDDVVLKVELTNPTLLRLDVFDELGRSVYGDGLGYKPQGEYRFTMPGGSWASGAYYARISTSGGEVQTVKLIKQ